MENIAHRELINYLDIKEISPKEIYEATAVTPRRLFPTVGLKIDLRSFNFLKQKNYVINFRFSIESLKQVNYMRISLEMSDSCLFTLRYELITHISLRFYEK